MSRDKVVLENIALGTQIGITVAIFVYGGYRLDEKYSMTPLYMIIGMVLGLVVAFYQLMKEVKRMDKISKEKKDDSNSRKMNKWM